MSDVKILLFCCNYMNDPRVGFTCIQELYEILPNYLSILVGMLVKTTHGSFITTNILHGGGEGLFISNSFSDTKVKVFEVEQF